MKYIALLLLISCKPIEHEGSIKFNNVYGMDNDYFYVVTVDSCEYVVFHGAQKGGIIHKANCKNHE